MSFCTKHLDIRAIRLDRQLQPRLQISDELVEEYAEAMSRGEGFPPVEAIHDGTDYWLWDGFHRYLAAQQEGKETIWTRITPGTKADAMWQSLGANATHGLRRSLEDVEKAVCKALQLKPAETDRLIAQHVGVSHSTVIGHRKKLEAQGKIPPAKERTGADGRRVRIRNSRKFPKYPSGRLDQKSIDPDQLCANGTGPRVVNAKVRPRSDEQGGRCGGRVRHSLVRSPCCDAGLRWRALGVQAPGREAIRPGHRLRAGQPQRDCPGGGLRLVQRRRLR